MDLSQKKLSKAEWLSIEVSVSDGEKQVLELILNGYADPNIRTNATQSMFSYMKIDSNAELEYYLYKEYFEKLIRDAAASNATAASHALNQWVDSVRTVKIKPPNKADMIRIQNVRNTVESPSSRNNIFEFVLLDFAKGAVSAKNAGYYLYSLVHFRKSTIPRINRYVAEFVDLVIAQCQPDSPASVRTVFENAAEYIERNPLLIRYEDMTLYSHQKQLFRVFQSSPYTPKLVLYMAPTGTGKTLSPIGLSNKYRVIFVCVARHVGLALAKSAISVGKRVAFAFGCETASDIRLHYFAAKDYKINKRSGGIGKVDNSVGDRVEIMICDVASYLTAMYYMLAFNQEHEIITFWDEPTITMDQQDDPLHATIHRNWCENRISKLVLSCATLPKHSEISATLNDFKLKFASEDEETGAHVEPEIHTIDSYDCKKTITLLNKEGRCVLPHLLFAHYRDVVRCVDHCEKNKTLLRYFNVEEVVRFIRYVETRGQVSVLPEQHFTGVAAITMRSIKQYYLLVLKSISPEMWPEIHAYMVSTLTPYFNPEPASSSVRKIQSVDSVPAHPSGGGKALTRTASVSATQPPQAAAPTNASAGILLTTKDAHTLTDGPTIFLAEDVDKIGKFYIQQSKIPEAVFGALMEKIERNNVIQRRIDVMEKELADKLGSSAATEKEQSKKAEREPANKETQRFMEQIAAIREQISVVSMSPVYIPNTKQHQDVWVQGPAKRNAFVPNIDEEDVREIMGLDVDNNKKLLLILGIGTFSQSIHPQYAETMKRLAYEQRLFLIIASSDYIYGTNYQFCHGFVGKDLVNMTQQKTIQAIGRIGRNNIQNEYTVRFRDDAILEQLFRETENNVEAMVMSRLFCAGDEEEEA